MNDILYLKTVECLPTVLKTQTLPCKAHHDLGLAHPLYLCSHLSPSHYSLPFSHTDCLAVLRTH